MQRTYIIVTAHDSGQGFVISVHATKQGPYTTYLFPLQYNGGTRNVYTITWKMYVLETAVCVCR